MQDPTTAATSSTPPQHLPPIALHSRLTRQTQNRATALGFGLLAPSPIPWLAFANTGPHHPPLPFDMANPKLSHCARFWPFSPKAPPPARVCERTIPPPLPHHPPHPTTSPHHPPLLFNTANLKPSRCAQFWVFSVYVNFCNFFS